MLFKKLGLDVLIHVVNAAGLSAFNPAERRMSPLSHDLAGIILPHDTFGSHLDVQGKTIDVELEQKNFLAAQEVLAEVWSKTGDYFLFIDIKCSTQMYQKLRIIDIGFAEKLGLVDHLVGL